MKAKRIEIIITVINVILLIICIISFFETSQNLRIFNSADDAFDYEEKKEREVDLTLYQGGKVTIVFHETNAEIKEAYRFTDKQELVQIIRFIRFYCELKGLIITRSNSDLWGECRIHTMLYAIGYKRTQTGNANIDFNKDERWYVNAIGGVLGWIGV